jgi:hypothetical protein
MYEQRCGECLANGRRCNRPWPHEGEECEWTPPAAVEEYEIVEDEAVTRMFEESIEHETEKRS